MLGFFKKINTKVRYVDFSKSKPLKDSNQQDMVRKDLQRYLASQGNVAFLGQSKVVPIKLGRLLKMVKKRKKI